MLQQEVKGGEGLGRDAGEVGGVGGDISALVAFVCVAEDAFWHRMLTLNKPILNT